MARRDSTPQDDERKSYGAVWLVCSLLLLVGALWAILDDNFLRRPWKKWQAGFSRVDHLSFKKTASRYPEIVELDNREQESLFVEAVK